MKKYCLGLAFDLEGERVLLIHKNRGPEFNIGKLNGLGGGVERGESSMDAIIREVQEEAGIKITNWIQICSLKAYKARIDVFAAKTNNIFNFKQMESEVVFVYNLRDFNLFECASNLKWLIPMSLSILDGDENCQSFEIEEIY